MNQYLQNSVALGLKYQKLFRHIGVKNVKKDAVIDEGY